jgi:hypothetical protein
MNLLVLVVLVVGVWALAMVFVLALLDMSSKQDRAARNEQAETAVRLFRHRWGRIDPLPG